MGITRNELKSIIKECLVEILVEGMGSSSAESIQESKKPIRQPIGSQKQQSPHVSTLMRNNASRIKMQHNPNTVNPTIKEAIKREAGGNDIMAAILADTAEKTLPTMIENDRTKLIPAAGGTVERIVASANPDELFGSETASKWAALAFMNTPSNSK